MKTGSFHEVIKNVIGEDIPNLGSIITLDNKGRLINSQFSKPSSSQTLLKLNSTDEVPDADDLPYGIISYGDTPNIINLPYNDHNYASVHCSKKLENYDRKALDYVSKQSFQISNRNSFPTSGSVRISHFSSFNSSAAHNDSVFFADKYKPQHQFTFNQQISHCSTPIVTNKTVSNISQNNNIYSKNKIMPSAIVINSGTVSKLKNMNVIQLRRPTIDTTNIGETRIINLPMKKPSVLTNIIMGNNQINCDRENITDKADLSKSINLIPRCVCGFTHDDGGMIRCEICRTWQHIVCMYPDNKFPIYYKCERCEPRDVDIKRAVATQTNVLLKTGYSPSDLVVNRDYDLDNDLENNFVKPTNSSHFVFVQPDSMNPYTYRSESLPNTALPIFIQSTKDSQTVPPGSPRTSKRKQDLISLKTVLGKPTLNVNIVTSKTEVQKPLLLENSVNFNNMTNAGYLVPISSHKLLSEARDISYPVNELSHKVKTILSSRLQYHTNMTVYHLHYLKQNSFTINTNMYDVALVDGSHYAVKTIVEFNSNEVIMEYNGYVSLAEEYSKELDYKKDYNPFVLFYDKFDHLQLCIDSKLVDNKAKYVRRSCTPNSEVKHRLLQDGQIRFYVVPINRIYKDSEITIAFDYNFMKCLYEVECACNQPSCQLIYLKMDQETKSQRANDEIDSQNMNIYDCANVNLGVDQSRTPIVVTRPYKKRGRGSKISNNLNRLSTESLSVNPVPKSTVKIIRRNKRGRPPLNRSLGIQRTNILVKPLSDNISNQNLSDLKDVSDNDSIHSQSHQNKHSRLTIHTNFKNFKRISSCHWSLKANRKMAAVAKKSKPLKKLLISPKVGRPMKIKKLEPIELEKDVPFMSDQSDTGKVHFNEERNFYSNDENDDGNMSPRSNRHDLLREEEGKYWLEEINNKILKQKVKEAKRIQRKNKYNRRKLNQGNITVSTENQHLELNKANDVGLMVQEKEVKEENINHENTEIMTPTLIENVVPRENMDPIIKKGKRGRKSLKQNTSYILSYKPSNIDDLKNDLMLISASLEEEVEKDVDVKYNIKEEFEECLNEANTADATDCIVQQPLESIHQTMSDTITKEQEPDLCIKPDETLDHRIYRSKSKRRGHNKNNGSGKDMSRKASREERWVNIMWQRILKSEHSDDKSKRKRSKSSAAEDSIASEDNRNESSEIGSPKIGNSEMSEDRDSSSNSKSSSAHKNRRKIRSHIINESDVRVNEPSLTVKVDCAEVKNEKSNTVSMTSSGSVDESQLVEHKDTSEQCGLIVYKEQHSNPMEKFSRENSAKLFTLESYPEGVKLSSNANNVCHQHHTKKRWLSQALMDETFSEESLSKSDNNTDQDISFKISSIDNNAKRSFLPPVFTSMDSIDLLSSNVQKVAINPKKRLLNQFSLEDTALRSYTDESSADNALIEHSNYVQYKSSQSEPSNIDQEQAKTKLTLSEYRKRRYIDKVPSEFSNILTKTYINSSEFNEAWIGVGQITPNMERLMDETDEYGHANLGNEETYNDNIAIDSKDQRSQCSSSENKCDYTQTSNYVSLSYIDTLNTLAMPTNLGSELPKERILNDDCITQNLMTQDYVECVKKEVIEQKYPPELFNSVNDDISHGNGPRTPSENEDVTKNVAKTRRQQPGRQSEESVHSFESQPSPTSDSHFDLDKDIKSIKEVEKSVNSTSTPVCPTDWMTNTVIIGKLAGIKNPDLLQEIEEFEDEYIPMPENLPERTEEEIETLLLTQKRDSQIREWQEVKQLEREKVKLDHQVRSMERRLHRANRTSEVKVSASLKSQNSLDDSSKNPLANYDVKNDEKTMKAFNVQLANINGRLMEQINSLRSDGPCHHSRPHQHHEPESVVTNEGSCGKHRKMQRLSKDSEVVAVVDTRTYAPPAHKLHTETQANIGSIVQNTVTVTPRAPLSSTQLVLPPSSPSQSPSAQTSEMTMGVV